MGPGGPGGPGGPNGPGGQGNHGGPPPPNSGQGSGDSSGQGHAGNAGHEGFQFGPVGRWWDDKSVVQQIGLSKEQQKKMDAIFNQNKPAILSTYKAFLKQKSSLEALNKNPSADKATVFAAIDAASQARTALEKATTQMLLEIKQQMSPDQIEKLEKLK
jgi:Spy/CpxP family protein refolding chaperone